MFRFLFFKFYDIINLGENMNLKNKGFTLVELLAVLVILGLLGLIVVPVVDKIIKDTRNNLYELQIKNIE